MQYTVISKLLSLTCTCLVLHLSTRSKSFRFLPLNNPINRFQYRRLQTPPLCQTEHFLSQLRINWGLGLRDNPLCILLGHSRTQRWSFTSDYSCGLLPCEDLRCREYESLPLIMELGRRRKRGDVCLCDVTYVDVVPYRDGRICFGIEELVDEVNCR